MITEQININEFYWSVKTKFKLEIGLKNKLIGQYAAGENSLYPDIVWFPQGTFILTAFNTSIGTNSCSISLSGKDKMCMLNGELGGQLFASIDFGTEETMIRTMKLADNVNATSSDILMVNTYYKKLSIEDFPQDENHEYINILSTDSIYIFAPSENGSYYKNGNQYSYITEGIRTNTKYDIYKLITHPSELFVRYEGNYSANQYYYEKNTGYYVLDAANTATTGREYFELVDLYIEDYTYNIVQIPLEKIIREAVHAYAKEPYHNIIINDLDDYGLEQLTYKGEETLYALRNKETEHFTQMTFANRNESLDACVNSQGFLFDALNPTTNATGTIIYQNEQSFHLIEPGVPYTVAKIEYGDDIGYRLTDLVYTGDLISAIGDSLTSVLDKIKTMLGDFEYFYDLQGRFVFQRKRTYVNTSWSQLTDSGDEIYVDYVNSDRKKFSFNFEGNRLISAIQNSPVLTNLKNDFSVWGKRKTLSGKDVPIHARYAIDKKPVFYKALNGKVYTVSEQYAIEQLNISTDNVPDAVYDRIKNFEMQYGLANLNGLNLTAPVKQANGSWSPGWWNIKDWGRFYQLLNDDIPKGTMKFYSRGDENGCIPIRSLGDAYSSYPMSTCVWLIEVNTQTGTVSFGHGRGAYGTAVRNCVYYESEIVNDNVVTTRTDKTKEYCAPYSGCSDNHTYLYFLNQPNREFYFYNPDFPDVSYEELVDNKISEAYREWQKNNQIYFVDWREILYQMALDFFAGQGCSTDNPIYLYHYEYDNETGTAERIQEGVLDDPDHFLYEVASRNPYYYPTGMTGYEQYYTDMQGFWRQLYNPEYIPVAKYETGKYSVEPVSAEGSQYYIKIKQWNETLLSDFDFEFYVNSNNTDIQYWRNQLEEEIAAARDAGNESRLSQLLDVQDKFDKYSISYSEQIGSTNEEEREKRLYWNTAVFEAPETLNFWIEFLDSGTELAQFSIPMVGDRSKTVNEDKAGAIVYKEIPDLILYDTQNPTGTGPDLSKIRKEITEQSGYTFIYLPKGFSQYLNISYRGLSVKNKVDELLYQFAYCIENITLTAIPIYYLQPNTRIYVQDKTTQINGEYIVSKITLPLTYNGTMSITATKAPERLY